jgi:ring-1,2-phenylacetyl-CoA epoxidase subunit PaaD
VVTAALRQGGVLDRDRALERAREAASAVVDPELPMLTLADLGVLREVTVGEDGAVVAAITPTYSGCPAMAAMRDDLVRQLRAAGFADARVLAARARPAPVRPGPAAAHAHAARRPLPAVRVGRRRGRLGVRLHRLQGAVPLPGLPRAVRAREGDLT